MSNDLLRKVSAHQNQWVALNKTRTKILAIGKTIKEVEAKIKEEEVIVMKVLPKNRLYAPYCS